MPFVLIAGGCVVAVVLTAVGIGDLFRAYPAEFIVFTVFAATTMGAAAVARIRASNRQVPLAPPAPRQLAAPRRIPLAGPPPAAEEQEGDRCEGPECGWFLDSNPWSAEVDSGPLAGEHLFCSEKCLLAWQDTFLGDFRRPTR